MSLGRNSPCPCGSGKKFKHCCQVKAASLVPPVGSEITARESHRLNALRRNSRELYNAEQFMEATAPLSEIVRLRPENADAHYDLGVAYIRCGRYVEAAESFRNAVKIRSSFTGALEQLAQALEYCANNSEASLIYGKLNRNAEGRQQKLYYTAKVQILGSRLGEAEATLRRLLHISPNNGRFRHLLGQVLIDQRRFEEAAPQLRLALETYPSSFHKLAAMQRMTEAERPLLKRLRSTTQNVGLDAEDRTLILYGLGKAYDDLGEYEEAIHCYDAANALRQKSAHFERAALARRYDGVIERYGAENLNRLSQNGGQRARADGQLPILIVGLPRSGTTLVEQILSSHPAVAAAGELQYWRICSAELERETNAWRDTSLLQQAAGDYLKSLRHIGPSALRVTDKAPLNFETLGLIMTALPQCRVIHCQRQPVDTCLSIYFTEFSSSLGFAFDRGNIAYFYRQYRRLMEHWRNVLAADRFLEVDYENLVANPDVVIRRMIAFAGLPWDEKCLAPEQNDRVVRTASLWQVRQPIYKTSVERWRQYEPWLGEIGELGSDRSIAG